MLTVLDFLDGPGGRICATLGIPMQGVATWEDLVRAAARRQDLAKAARRLDGVASSGERAVLHAALAAMDFAWLADELGKGPWRRIDLLNRNHRLAVAAVVARQDPPHEIPL